MPAYSAPLRDHLFCLYELFDFEGHTRLPGLDGCTRDIVEPVLEQAARFASEVLSPLNRPADEEGCHFEDGVVTTPKGFRDAYARLVEGGWPSLTCALEHGGQGMPHMVNVLFEEMINAACLSFGLFPGLNRGAYVALARHGTPDQIDRYARKLASGEWAGAMCLTEAQAGTDLGLMRTQAVPRPDGSYALTGTKIFISAGEHDLTPNIVYLVLARLPDAPSGTRGISLFVVPKFIVDGEGLPGVRNGVSCGSIEAKMGMHGNPTCVMNFDGATGWLAGAPHQGLKAMFAMMNTERLAVGIHGLAAAEASLQNARAYARERRQGRAPGSPNVADAIIVHADVRRMLMMQKALTEGCRMLALWTAQWLDVSERQADPVLRQQADDVVALLTPVVKAFLTDCGSDVANFGIQIFGGHGFIRANGQEQLVRDVRVTQIYEGTNGVQAMDLLGRKVLGDGGAALSRLLRPVEEELAERSAKAGLAEFVVPAEQALWRLQEATALLTSRANGDVHEPGAAAADYLRLTALTLTGALWTRAAEASLAGDDPFHRAKCRTARFFMLKILPETHTLLERIRAGADCVMALPEDDF